MSDTTILKHSTEPLAWLAYADMLEERGDWEHLIKHWRRMGEWGRILIPVIAEMARCKRGYDFTSIELLASHTVQINADVCRTPRRIELVIAALDLAKSRILKKCYYLPVMVMDEGLRFVPIGTRKESISEYDKLRDKFSKIAYDFRRW
jgi:hypothetical protein